MHFVDTGNGFGESCYKLQKNEFDVVREMY